MMKIVCIVSLLHFSFIAAAGESIDPAVAAKVKAATVYIPGSRLAATKGKDHITGFFCEGPLIVACFDVSVAIAAGAMKKMILYKGDPREMEVEAEALAVDQESGVWLLKPKLKDGLFPEPLKLSPATEIAPLTPAYRFGFPGIRALMDMETIPEAACDRVLAAALRPVAKLPDTQINECGGPIVLDNGEVIGLALEGNRKNTIEVISLAALRRTLNGDVRDVDISGEKVQPDKFTIHVKASDFDFLKRIKSVTLMVWTAEPGSVRPVDSHSGLRTHGAPGDSAPLEFEMKNDPVRGWNCDVRDLSMPANREFWYQVKVTHADGPPMFLEAKKHDLVPAAPVTSGFPGFQASRQIGWDGQSYIAATSKAEKLTLPKDLIQLVADPDGKLVYGIFKDLAAIKVFSPPTFKEIDEIPAPQYPVSIYCDAKRLAVACSQSKVVAIIDTETRKQIRAISLEKKPELIPVRIITGWPDGAIMTLWEIKGGQLRNASLYKVFENGESQFVIQRDISWCTPMETGLSLLIQTNNGSGNTGSGCVFNFSDTSKPPVPVSRTLSGILSDELGNCFESRDHRRLILPREDCHVGKVEQTFVVAPDLGRAVLEFPGVTVAEFPSENAYVTTSQHPPVQINYVSRTTGQIVRAISVNGISQWASSQRFAWPLQLFLPKHELLLACVVQPGEGYLGEVYAIRCGPIENSPQVRGASISNTPAAVARVGKPYSFVPEYSYNNGVTFGLKRKFDGMTIDKNSGAIAWTPGDAYAGAFDVTLFSNDGNQEREVLTWTVDVQP